MIIHLIGTPSINIVTKIHSIHMINPDNLFTNFKKKSSIENQLDYRKQEPNTTCYIPPNQQQKRKWLQMRKGPTFLNNKENIFKNK